jgi:hypothetical protein
MEKEDQRRKAVEKEHVAQRKESAIQSHGFLYFSGLTIYMEVYMIPSFRADYGSPAFWMLIRPLPFWLVMDISVLFLAFSHFFPFLVHAGLFYQKEK